MMFNVSLIQNATDMNWDIDSFLYLNEMVKKSDDQNKFTSFLGVNKDEQTLVANDVSISKKLQSNGIYNGITPEEFEANVFTLNFPFEITSLKKTYVANTEVYTNGNVSKETFLDMSITGMHLD